MKKIPLGCLCGKEYISGVMQITVIIMKGRTLLLDVIHDKLQIDYFP